VVSGYLNSQAIIVKEEFQLVLQCYWGQTQKSQLSANWAAISCHQCSL